jgi:hypothetical protein
MENWERRLNSADRRPPPAPADNGSHAIVAHEIAQYTSVLPSIEPGTTVTITIRHGAGPRTSVQVTWDVRGQAHITPVGQPVSPSEL